MSHELRWNPLLGTWIIVAGHRKKRPWRPEEKGIRCPFCPGGPETSGEWDVLVLPNKYPALSPEAPEPRRKEDPLYRAERAVGVCEVVVETPQHEGDLCDLPLEQVHKFINALSEEYKRLSGMDYIECVMMFRNKGAVIGVSLHHPHSQIYALPFVPPRIEVELRRCKEYMERHGRCLICDIIAKEVDEGTRLLYENKHFIAFLPYFAMWPYEVHIYPKRHVPSIDQLTDEERLHLADILRVVTAGYNKLFDFSMPYIMVFHQKPTKGDYPYYHMHIEFYPPYREKDKLKYAAGIEWGAWVFTYDGVPEEKAAELRNAFRRALEQIEHLGDIP
ncbi:MAG: galactose-1-phosphate uridylyltransferase [Thermoprotei archaeon]|nr:MAG: galactose-1-phosphate uridylyltransferase [Thermoprotei archaeon]